MMTAPNLPMSQLVDPAQALWGMSLQPAGCPACKRVFLVQPNRIGSSCPACFQGQLASQPAWLRPEPPELLVPFGKRAADLQSLLAGFTRGVWLHADDFTPERLIQRLRPVYVPMWLVDSDMTGNWQADTGFDYQVKSSQDSYHEGRWVSHDLVETRVRWEPRLGQLKRHYDNIATPAVMEYLDLSNRLGAYELSASVPYQPAMIGAADIRIPDQQPEHAWPAAAASLERVASEECRRAASADHIRQYQLAPAYTGVNWTQLLLPLYATYYTRDDGLPETVLVNGQTGVVSGLRLASQKKGWRLTLILELLALGAFLVGLLATIIPPITLLGILLILASFCLATGGIVTAAWPWQWNRGQQPRKVIRLS